MVAKEKTPKAKKQPKAKAQKTAKPKQVKILDTDLDKLRLAADTLEKMIEAKERADQMEAEAELAGERAKDAKAAYRTAKKKIDELIEAYRKPLPLFDGPKKKVEKPAEKPAAPAVTLPTVTIAGDEAVHGLPVGSSLPVWLVNPAGVLVTGPDGNPTAITDDEYTADVPTKDLIGQARSDGVLSDADAWREFVATKQAPAPEPNPVANDGWKALPLDAAGINGRGGKLLTEAGHDTLGKVAKLMRDHGQWWNKEVRGIGEETAAEIADRFADFWRDHPEHCQTEAAA